MKCHRRIGTYLFFFMLLVWLLPATALADMSADELRMNAIEEKLQTDPHDFRVFFKDGLKFETGDGMFKYQVGGRIMWDIGTLDADDDIEAEFGEQDAGSEFRRARIFLSGLIYNRIKFKAQYDIAGQVEFKDVYIALTGIPFIGNFQVGHFKEPFSLEELTSSKYITFMERSLANTFVPGRNAGIAIYNTELWNKRMTAAFGVFETVGETPPDRLGDDGYNISMRVTGTPWNENKGKQLVHLGFAYSHISPEDDLVRFRSRPEVHLTDDRFVDTRDTAISLVSFVSPTQAPLLFSSRDADGDLMVEDVNLFGFEAAGVYNAASIQGEFILANTDVWGTDTANLYGFYVEGSYFLTGEHRKYKKGSFSRVKPKNNFGHGGYGAWQVAVRYSMIDLNDSDALVFGGEEDNVTVGVNWYLNPNTRVMFNYVHADPDRDDKGISLGEMDTVMTRFQIDF